MFFDTPISYSTPLIPGLGELEEDTKLTASPKETSYDFKIIKTHQKERGENVARSGSKTFRLDFTIDTVYLV